MKRLLFLFLLFIIVGNLAMAANFTDDFESGDMASWVVVDDPDELMSDKSPSTWEIKGGPIKGKAVYQGSNRWGDPTDQISLGTYLIYDEAEWTDFSLSFDVIANDNDGMGCVWRWKDRLNHYRFMTVMDPGSRGPFRRIERRLGDKGDEFPFYEFLAKSDESYVQGVVINIRVEVKGTKMTVFMDNKEVLTATDDTYDKGKIGFALYAQQAYFDNVKVTDLGSAVEPIGKTAVKWGELKKGNVR